MKNRFLKKMISILLAGVVLFGTMIASPTNLFAFEFSTELENLVAIEEGEYGKLLVSVLDSSRTPTYFKVYVENDLLYVRADSFAQSLGYQMDCTENCVQFLNSDKSRLVSFYYDSTEVAVTGISHGTLGNTKKYVAPTATLNKEGNVWIPFMFASKIMGREIVINTGEIMISSEHETVTDAIESVEKPHVVSEASIRMNKAMEANQFIDAKTSPLLTLCAYAEYSLFDILDTKYGSQNPADYEITKANLDEVASYLVANTAPETASVYLDYGEMMTMYLEQEMFVTGMDGLEAMADGTFSESAFARQGTVAVEESARRLAKENGTTLKADDAFRSTYQDLLGYNPITEEWENQQRYDYLLSSLLVYVGEPNVLAVDGLNLLTGDFQLGYVYGGLTSVYNMTTRNHYAQSCFEDYLGANIKHVDSRKDATRDENGKTGYENFIDTLQSHVDSYGTYEAGQAENYVASMVEVWIEELLVPDFLYKIITYIRVAGDVFSYEDKQLLNNYTSYFYADMLAREISSNRGKIDDEKWAYLFYKTDFTANTYYKKCFSNSNTYKLIGTDDAREIASCAQQAINEDLKHLTALNMDVSYGLSLEDNKEYNSIYDDSKLIAYVIPLDMTMGNTNANSNNGGIAVVGEKATYVAFQAMEANIILRNGGKRKYEVLETKASWLNLYETEDGDEWLYYIDGYGDICCYIRSENKSHTVLEGDCRQLMLAYGYLYYTKENVLYRMEFNKGELKDEEIVTTDVGSCIYYTDSMIYYTNTANYLLAISCEDVQQTVTPPSTASTVEALEVTPVLEMFPVHTSSFDIASGNVYYANLDDGNRIYAYNLLTGISVCLGEDTTEAYGIMYHNGSIFYKKYSETEEGVLYSLVPFTNISLPRAYSIVEKDIEDLTGGSHGIAGDEFGHRQFAISGNQIYNQDYLWCSVHVPLNGVNIEGIVEMGLYRLCHMLEER